MADSKHLSLIGAGAWGTAMAKHLAENGEQVLLYCRDKDQAAAMAGEHQNARYLPGVILPDNLVISSSMPQCLAHAADIMLAVPSSGFNSTLQDCKPLLGEHHRLSWLTKGLSESGGFLHQQAIDITGDRPIAAVSGPSFAGEVAMGLPTALTVASNDEDFARELALRLHNRYLRAYTSDDLIGVQLGGVVKNIVAIAAGISDGLGFGANARAALITRAMAELSRLGLVLGARTETLMGLTGLGDLILTCTDNQSRNRRMGLALAKGMSLEQAQRQIGHAVEGVRNVALVCSVAAQKKVEMPISEQVYAVVQGRCSPMEAVAHLLERRIKSE